MALTRFYDSGLADVDLAKEVLAKTPDIYIQKYEYIGSGVYAISTGGVSTLTPATSPSWSINAYASTVAKNLLIVDDNSKVAQGKVVSNIATAITFDETAMLLEEDETTAASLTAGSTYNFYVLTPSATTGQTYGPFVGYTEGNELALTDTMMKFKYGQPRALKFKDLQEREGKITGGFVNWTNTDVIAALFGGVAYGSQSAKYRYGVGHAPDTDVFYRLTFIGEDRNNRVFRIVVHKVQFESSGNLLSAAESGHKMAPFTVDITADSFFPENADMMLIERVG
jgi:hypothetical protein